MKISKYSAIISMIIVEAVLLVGILGASLVLGHRLPSWLSGISENWLVVLFQMNISGSGVTAQNLGELHWIDFLLFVFIGLVFFRLFQRMRKGNAVWASIALSLPLLGAIILFLTKTAGRSGLLLGGLIYSILMLRDEEYGRTPAIIGICGSILLFFGGDIGTTIFPPNLFVAGMICLGYALWIVWYAMILQREIRSGQ